MRDKMKRCLSILLSLALALGLVPGMGVTAYAKLPVSAVRIGDNLSTTLPHMHDNILFEPWNETTSLPATAGSYYLTGDVTLSSTWIVPIGDNNICLNGYRIIPNVEEPNPTMIIRVNAMLRLYDNNHSGENVGGTVTPHDVTVTPGNHMTKTAASGAASQTGLTGTMTPVVFTADEGYYFATNYSVKAVNGISVTRDSDTQITVFGAPTADAAIVLPDATALAEAKVQVIWDDQNDQDQMRPASLSLDLLADGVKVNTVKVGYHNDWGDTVTGLKKEKEGVDLHYTWSVPRVEGYVHSVTLDPDGITSQVTYKHHTHDFTYSAGTGENANILTATCGSGSDCVLPGGVITLTIAAPTLTTYGQTGEGIRAEATLTGLDAFNAATRKSIAATDITYVGREGTAYEEKATAPTGVGKYTARITLAGVKTSEGYDESVTASVDYEIVKAPQSAPAMPSVTAVTADSITVRTVRGVEFSIDGEHWQTSGVFTGLNPDTTYVIQARKPATTNHNVSPVSKTVVNTPATTQPGSSGSWRLGLNLWNAFHLFNHARQTLSMWNLLWPRSNPTLPWWVRR